MALNRTMVSKMPSSWVSLLTTGILPQQTSPYRSFPEPYPYRSQGECSDKKAVVALHHKRKSQYHRTETIQYTDIWRQIEVDIFHKSGCLWKHYSLILSQSSTVTNSDDFHLHRIIQFLEKPSVPSFHLILTHCSIVEKADIIILIL